MVLVLRKKTLFLFVSALCIVLCLCFLLGDGPVAAAERKVPVYRVETEEKRLSITFDAAWGADKTLKILDELDRFQVKATFFLVGFWVEKYPETVAEIAKRGHEIGTHSNTHPHMSKLSRAEIQKELQTSCEKIENITQRKVTVFRAPFGDYNNALLEEAGAQGLTTIQWDVDSLDWKGLSATEICNRIVKRAQSGSIILCHNNSDHIVEALPQVLMTLQMKGFRFVPVGQNLHTNGTVDSQGIQHATN